MQPMSEPERTLGMQLVEARFGKPVDQLLREQYLDEGLGQPQIAAMFGVRKSTVSRWMRTFGIPIRHIGNTKRRTAA